MRKRRSVSARRKPGAGWGFDLQPHSFNPPAVRFALPLVDLKEMPDIIKIHEDILLSLPDIIKSSPVHIKTKHVELLGLLNNIKSRRVPIKSKQDKLLSMLCNWINPLINLHPRIVNILSA
jgi:hypothetical protein